MLERDATLPHPPAIVQAACPTEGGEEVVEAGFPFAFAGKTGGQLCFALRAGGVGQQFGDDGELFGQRGGPRGWGDFTGRGTWDCPGSRASA
jgi:hypothetical protein